MYAYIKIKRTVCFKISNTLPSKLYLNCHGKHKNGFIISSFVSSYTFHFLVISEIIKKLNYINLHL